MAALLAGLRLRIRQNQLEVLPTAMREGVCGGEHNKTIQPMKTKPNIRMSLLAALGLAVLAGLQPAIAQGKADPRGATIETGSGVFIVEDVLEWFEPVGEEVLISVYAPFTYRLILTPRGDFVYVEQWDTEAVTGTMIGIDSGIVWTRTKNLSPYIVRSSGGGMEHYTFKGTFVSEDGPTIEVHEVYHVSYDANGELRVELHKFHARLK